MRRFTILDPDHGLTRPLQRWQRGNLYLERTHLIQRGILQQWRRRGRLRIHGNDSGQSPSRRRNGTHTPTLPQVPHEPSLQRMHLHHLEVERLQRAKLRRC